MTTHSTDEEWIRWIEAQTKATEIWAAGDLPGAIERVNPYLEGMAPPDLRRKAIAFRGDLLEEHGDREAAWSDFQLAHSLSEKPDYERYTLEISLGSLAGSHGELRVADYWYVKALETASADLTTSGGTALLRLLKLRRNRGLAEAERDIAKKVVRQSWHLLGMEGEPDLDDLEGSAKKLIEAQSRPA